MAIYADNWGGLTPENRKYIDDKYERFVPWSGKANTVGGEIVRAINRIVYRFYNDGDTVYYYYGSSKNLNWACDDYLCNHVDGYVTLKDVYDDTDFERQLSRNFNHIAEWLMKNESLFSQENDTDCLDNAPLVKDDDEDDEYDEDEEEW